MRYAPSILAAFACVLLILTGTAYAQAQITTDASGLPSGPYVHGHNLRDMHLIEQPRVHSMTSTTANLRWITSLPAECEIGWGLTPACENRLTLGVRFLGTFSLKGLSPGETYYFQIRSLKLPTELEDRYIVGHTEGKSEILRFTTPATDAPARTYYVSPEGDDNATGSSLENAWQTISHAASQVKAGDTVLIAGGQYDESIPILATGDVHAPITFRGMPGQKAVITGAEYSLAHGFMATGKHHLRFDYLYFKHFNAKPLQGWRTSLSGTFSLQHCSDIQITRCFDDGRGTYSARFVNAVQVDHLLIQNCVILNKMSGSMMLWPAPNLRIDHTVIARPMISAMVLRNDADEPATITNSIFTDMLKKKAALNIGLFTFDFKLRDPILTNNCFYLREFSPEERHLFNHDRTASQYGSNLTGAVFENPLFAGDSSDPAVHGIDQMLYPDNDLDFSDFFTNNPTLIQRNIGLQREAFE